MHFLDIIIIAIGLSMDAFAVAIGKGLSASRFKGSADKAVKRKFSMALTLSLWFGIFHIVMPLIGYFITILFSNIDFVNRFISAADHWIAFILLSYLGINMIREAFSDENMDMDDSFSAKSIFPLAIATSIDVLTMGVTFACMDCSSSSAVLKGNIFLNCSTIGFITFCITFIGLYIGSFVGSKFNKNASIFGGIVLISIGIKILLEHL